MSILEPPVLDEVPTNHGSRNRLRVIASVLCFVLLGALLVLYGLPRYRSFQVSKARQALSSLGLKLTDEEFLKQVGEGNLKNVELFLRSGITPNTKNRDAKTALMVAAESNHLNVVQLLLKYNADINARNIHNSPALFFATAPNIAGLLISEEVTLDTRNEYGNTVLHTAAYGGSVELYEYLIQKKANINCQNASGGTPLHFAVARALSDERKGTKATAIEIVKLLVQNGASTNTKGCINPEACGYLKGSPLYMAITVGDREIVNTLLSLGTDVNAYADFQIKLPVSEVDLGATPLYTAVATDKYDIAEALLNAGADPNLRTGKDELMGSVPADMVSEQFRNHPSQDQVRMMKLLLEHGTQRISISGSVENELASRAQLILLRYQIGAKEFQKASEALMNSDTAKYFNERTLVFLRDHLQQAEIKNISKDMESALRENQYAEASRLINDSRTKALISKVQLAEWDAKFQEAVVQNVPPTLNAALARKDLSRAKANLALLEGRIEASEYQMYSSSVRKLEQEVEAATLISDMKKLGFALCAYADRHLEIKRLIRSAPPQQAQALVQEQFKQFEEVWPKILEWNRLMNRYSQQYGSEEMIQMIEDNGLWDVIRKGGCIDVFSR